MKEIVSILFNLACSPYLTQSDAVILKEFTTKNCKSVLSDIRHNRTNETTPNFNGPSPAFLLCVLHPPFVRPGQQRFDLMAPAAINKFIKWISPKWHLELDFLNKHTKVNRKCRRQILSNAQDGKFKSISRNENKRWKAKYCFINIYLWPSV